MRILSHAVLKQGTVTHPSPLYAEPLSRLSSTYKKRESAGHTQLHDYTKAHSSTLYSFLIHNERRKHVGWSLAAGITNARYHSDSDRQSMRQSHHPVSTSCHRFFIQLTVKIYQKLWLRLDPMDISSSTRTY